MSERKRIKAQELADQKEADKKAGDEAAAAAEKARERAKQAAKNRLDNARTLRDFELSQIKDANEREIAIVNEKYARLMNDLKNDANKTAAEKAKFNEAEDGIYASFKISASMQGSDALMLASEQLIDGLSVGVDVIKSSQKKDYIYVTKAQLKEVSLVESPAFTEAQVTKVAASEGGELGEVGGGGGVGRARFAGLLPRTELG